EPDKLIVSSPEELIGADDYRVDPLVGEAREGGVDGGFAARTLDWEPQPKRERGSLRVSSLGFGSWIRWVDKETDNGRAGDQLAEQFQPFRGEGGDQKRHPRDIPTRPIETGNQTELDRIGTGREYNRNGRSCSFGRYCSRRADCKDDGYRVGDQRGGQCR